jgi:hypothetical protein
MTNVVVAGEQSFLFAYPLSDASQCEAGLANVLVSNQYLFAEILYQKVQTLSLNQVLVIILNGKIPRDFLKVTGGSSKKQKASKLGKQLIKHLVSFLC